MNDLGGEITKPRDSRATRKYNELLSAYEIINKSRAIPALSELRLEVFNDLLRRGYTHEETGEMIRASILIGVSPQEEVKNLARSNPRLSQDLENVSFITPFGETFYKSQLLRRYDIRGIRNDESQKGLLGVEVTAFAKGNIRVARVRINEDQTLPVVEYLGSQNIPKTVWEGSPTACRNVIRNFFYGNPSKL